MQYRSSLAHRFELAHQRVDGIDVVVVVSANQQVLHIRPGQQILEQIERCRIEPLEIVEKQGERMFWPCEYADKSLEHKLRAALRFLWWELGDRWLISYDVLQFWDARLVSAIPASSDETSATAKPRRSKGSKLEADEGTGVKFERRLTLGALARDDQLLRRLWE